VLIATDTPLDLNALKTIDTGNRVPLFAQRVLDEGAVQALLSEGRVVMLTDQYAPVDQMLAPVFRGEIPR